MNYLGNYSLVAAFKCNPHETECCPERTTIMMMMMLLLLLMMMVIMITAMSTLNCT